METEKKTFHSVGELLADYDRRLLELENDLAEMDVALEVIYSILFTLGVKPATIPELADRIRAEHQKAREEYYAKAKEAEALEHPVDGQQSTDVQPNG